MEKQHVTSEYEKAIQYIYSLMQDGTLQNGSKLPTERTIAEHLAVSRNPRSVSSVVQWKSLYAVC